MTEEAAYGPVCVLGNVWIMIDEWAVFAPQEEGALTKPTDVFVIHPNSREGERVSLYHLLVLMRKVMGSEEEKQLIAFLVRNTANQRGEEPERKRLGVDTYSQRLLSAAIAVDLYFHQRILPNAKSLTRWANSIL